MRVGGILRGRRPPSAGAPIPSSHQESFGLKMVLSQTKKEKPMFMVALKGVYTPCKGLSYSTGSPSPPYSPHPPTSADYASTDYASKANWQGLAEG